MVFLSRYTQAGAALAIGIGSSLLFSWGDQWFITPAQAQDAVVHQAREDAVTRYVASIQQDSLVERCFRAGQVVRTLVHTGEVAKLAQWHRIRQQDCRASTGTDKH